MAESLVVLFRLMDPGFGQTSKVENLKGSGAAPCRVF